MAKRLRGFEVTILYYDPFARSPDVEQNLGVNYADLDELVRTADIVSLHLPLLPQTAGIINAQRIRRDETRRRADQLRARRPGR